VVEKVERLKAKLARHSLGDLRALQDGCVQLIRMVLADLARAVRRVPRSVVGSLQPGVIAPVVAEVRAATESDAGRCGRVRSGVDVLTEDARVPRANLVRLPVVEPLNPPPTD
jgi:hypothetical protein